MLFGTKFDSEVYEPWRAHYMDYNTLKKLLKEGVIMQNNWTDKDEQTFVSALDQALEKVYSFQSHMYEELNEELDGLQLHTETASEEFDVASFSTKLEETLEMAQELDHFQRLNYTGFVKIVKKHDRNHPEFSVKPLLNVRLKNLPFHSEDYSPLLYKISALFQFLRENYHIDQSLSKLSSFNDESQEQEFKSFKFWIHPDNLMEVKTTILRHLPVLVYNNGDLSYFQDEDEDDSGDPTINCLYFDNPDFDLYNQKLNKTNNASTLRIKWIGKLSNKPKISVEKKMFDVTSEEVNVDEKITLKEKYLDAFVKGDFEKDKLVKKMIKNGDQDESIKRFTEQVSKLSNFVKENKIQPCMRTVYKRTAFQIPGDNKVRVVIDSDLKFIREDAFDQERPIRDPSKWHRSDIDRDIANPHSLLRKGESSNFPYSVMEVKVKAAKKAKLAWVDELINSHLVKEIPNFSKFIQGVAALFLEDDKLDNIPLWFNELEEGIMVDPQQAFLNTKKKLEKLQSEEENFSKFKSMLSSNKNILSKSRTFSLSQQNNLDAIVSQDVNQGHMNELEEIQEVGRAQEQELEVPQQMPTDLDDQSSDDFENDPAPPISRFLKLPTKFAKLNDVDSEDEEIELPAGVTKPESFIKNAGPLKIEPKVWLANERTFNRWLHVTTLLSSLTFIIYSSAGKANFFELSETLAYIYFGLTLFSGVWGYYVFIKRREIIMERSGKHLDNMFGPLVIAFGLIIGLVINFVFGWKRIASARREKLEVAGLSDSFYENNTFHMVVHNAVIDLLGV